MYQCFLEDCIIYRQLSMRYLHERDVSFENVLNGLFKGYVNMH